MGDGSDARVYFARFFRITRQFPRHYKEQRVLLMKNENDLCFTCELCNLIHNFVVCLEIWLLFAFDDIRQVTML